MQEIEFIYHDDSFNSNFKHLAVLLLLLLPMKLNPTEHELSTMTYGELAISSKICYNTIVRQNLVKLLYGGLSDNDKIRLIDITVPDAIRCLNKLENEENENSY